MTFSTTIDFIQGSIHHYIGSNVTQLLMQHFMNELILGRNFPHFFAVKSTRPQRLWRLVLGLSRKHFQGVIRCDMLTCP